VTDIESRNHPKGAARSQNHLKTGDFFQPALVASAQPLAMEAMKQQESNQEVLSRLIERIKSL